MAQTVIVVPCYNEYQRLCSATYLAFCREHPSIDFFFVDDGSTDATGERLDEMQAVLPDRIHVLGLTRNQGKAEAVRQGVLHAYWQQPAYIGYWDADLATPLEAIPDFVSLLAARPSLNLVMGSRVSLLGREIQRSYKRHVLGRTFATVASFVLGLPVYDTQCGAKLFRATSSLQALFTEPFRSRWIFDVEILARMVQQAKERVAEAPRRTVAEMPLQSWRDVAGSKLRPQHFLKAAAELAAIYWHHRWQRHEAKTVSPVAAGSHTNASRDRQHAA